MGFYDFINFVVYDNPISKSVTSLVINKKSLPPPPNVTVITEKVPLWKLANEAGPFIRIAGLMGAAAVALGAYGAHVAFPKDDEEELKILFEKANKYHFIHTLALMGVPLCRNPKIAATLFISGTILFSGGLYYHALTGDSKFTRIVPIGGTTLILGWLAMVLMAQTVFLTSISK